MSDFILQQMQAFNKNHGFIDSSAKNKRYEPKAISPRESID
jgi:hypothetical protein